MERAVSALPRGVGFFTAHQAAIIAAVVRGICRGAQQVAYMPTALDKRSTDIESSRTLETRFLRFYKSCAPNFTGFPTFCVEDRGSLQLVKGGNSSLSSLELPR